MEEIINRIKNLTERQQQKLAEFLLEPDSFIEPSKDDICILAMYLEDIRNTRTYKKRKFSGSIEQSIYNSYVRDQEKKIENKLYSQLRDLNVQLRKGGYDSRMVLENFSKELTEEDKKALDSLFPENLGMDKGRVIPFSEEILGMSPDQLAARDQESMVRQKGLRAELSPQVQRKKTDFEETPETLEKLRNSFKDLEEIIPTTDPKVTVGFEKPKKKRKSKKSK